MAFTFYDRCKKVGLRVFTWNAGDFGVRVPELEGIVVHRTSGYRSKLPPNHRGMPVFIADPLLRFFNRNELILREKGERPVVGFCGQAAGNWRKYTIDVIRTTWRNARFYLGLSYEEPQWWYPSTLLRNRILHHLERDDRIDTNFIKRKKYRAGVKTEEERQRTALEFYQNMVESDYIVCVRGGGNFSVRLYETLAMGRIPLFVDTDCLLPLSSDKFWDVSVVRTYSSLIKHLATHTIQHHSKISYGAFHHLQIQCRKYWMDNLRLGGFFL